MKPSHSFPLRQMVLLALAAWSVSGCTTSFRMPWEDNPLDPSRIATREPLEIPPNLSQLPPAAQPAVEKAEKKDSPAPVASAPATTVESASSILFDTPAPAAKAAAPSRTENAPLPEWMSSSDTSARKSAPTGSAAKLPPESILRPKEADKASTKGRNAMTR